MRGSYTALIYRAEDNVKMKYTTDRWLMDDTQFTLSLYYCTIITLPRTKKNLKLNVPFPCSKLYDEPYITRSKPLKLDIKSGKLSYTWRNKEAMQTEMLGRH